MSVLCVFVTIACVICALWLCWHVLTGGGGLWSYSISYSTSRTVFFPFFRGGGRGLFSSSQCAVPTKVHFF